MPLRMFAVFELSKKSEEGAAFGSIVWIASVYNKGLAASYYSTCTHACTSLYPESN